MPGRRLINYHDNLFELQLQYRSDDDKLLEFKLQYRSSANSRSSTNQPYHKRRF